MFAETSVLAPAPLPTGTRLPQRRVAVVLSGVALASAALGFGAALGRRGDAAAAGLPPTAAGVVASVGRRPSHNRLYHAEVIAAERFAVGVAQRWTVHLTRRGGRRLANAELALVTRAPETGETSPVMPTARYVGGGDYRIEGIDFPRAGWWNVALVIRAAAGVDSVAFNIVLPSARTSDQAADPR